jgi:hypothetical protein
MGAPKDDLMRTVRADCGVLDNYRRLIYNLLDLAAWASSARLSWTQTTWQRRLKRGQAVPSSAQSAGEKSKPGQTLSTQRSGRPVGETARFFDRQPLAAILCS